jgi:hypothetical protein
MGEDDSVVINCQSQNDVRPAGRVSGGLWGVSGRILADRTACLKGGVVANVVVPASAYVRLAAQYGLPVHFRATAVSGHVIEQGCCSRN